MPPTRPGAPKPATIRDVARLAGVSIATVSRVLNGTGVSTRETEERVRVAASRLAFRPNRIGRSLKTQRTLSIGVIVPSIRNPVFAEGIAGVEAAARAAGYSVLLMSTGYDRAREPACVETLLDHQVDGLVLAVADADDAPALDKLDALGVPYVLVFNQPDGDGRSSVGIDNVAGAREAVAALVAAGHRRIAMLAGRRAESDRTALRWRGFVQAHREADLEPGPLSEVAFEAPDVPGAVASLFSGGDRPTALFCSTDMLAIAAIRALADGGLSVPADVSVVGFDGIAIGEALVPRLATVVQPLRAMGEAAVVHLLGRAAGAPPARETLAHRFRPGETVAPPPAGVPRPFRPSPPPSRGEAP